MHDDYRSVLRDNVRALLEVRTKEDSTRKGGIQGLIALGLSHGTAQRILEGQTSIGLDVLVQVARGLGVSPWMLLVPQLNCTQLPGLTEDQSAWPFPLVDQSAYLALTATERAFVQGGLARDINDLTAKRMSKRAANDSHP